MVRSYWPILTSGVCSCNRLVIMVSYVIFQMQIRVDLLSLNIRQVQKSICVHANTTVVKINMQWALLLHITAWTLPAACGLCIKKTFYVLSIGVMGRCDGRYITAMCVTYPLLYVKLQKCYQLRHYFHLHLPTWLWSGGGSDGFWNGTLPHCINN